MNEFEMNCAKAYDGGTTDEAKTDPILARKWELNRKMGDIASLLYAYKTEQVMRAFLNKDELVKALRNITEDYIKFTTGEQDQPDD